MRQNSDTMYWTLDFFVKEPLLNFREKVGAFHSIPKRSYWLLIKDIEKYENMNRVINFLLKYNFPPNMTHLKSDVFFTKVRFKIKYQTLEEACLEEKFI